LVTYTYFLLQAKYLRLIQMVMHVKLIST